MRGRVGGWVGAEDKKDQIHHLEGRIWGVWFLRGIGGVHERDLANGILSPLPIWKQVSEPHTATVVVCCGSDRSPLGVAPAVKLCGTTAGEGDVQE